MTSFQDLDRTFGAMPPRLGSLLSDIDVARGLQQLNEDQNPELLLTLAQRTKIESVKASVAIEGIDVPLDRAEKLVQQDQPRLRNRNEMEFAGYADAIDRLMTAEELQPPTPAMLLSIHAELFKHTAAQGGVLKKEDNVIMDRDPQGMKIKIFQPPPWQQTESLLRNLCEAYREAVEARAAHPLLLLAAFVLDFLAIHPVEDGNGRTARLATTSELLRTGYEVSRYVSIEQEIFESKNSYYAALQKSQENWHEGQHTIWPWAEYLCRVLKTAYETFENRVADARDGSGMSKQERVRHWVETAAPGEFRTRDVRRALPGVSEATIRAAIASMKKDGSLSGSGHGAGARWHKVATPREPSP